MTIDELEKDVIEAAAKAMCKAQGERWEQIPENDTVARGFANPGFMTHEDYRDDARAALIAAGVHTQTRIPTREQIAKAIAKRDGSYANFEDYLEDADRILVLLGGTP